MSIPRRLGRLARGFVLGLQDDERFRETLRAGRERGETFRETFGEAFGAAWRGAAEEWRTAEEEREEEERYRSQERSSVSFKPNRLPAKVLAAYGRLGLQPGASLDQVHKRRRELIKRHHPDYHSDPEERAKAERMAAEINGAHDTIRRHLLKN